MAVGSSCTDLPAVRTATTSGQLTQYSLRAQLVTGLASVKNGVFRGISLFCVFFYFSSVFALAVVHEFRTRELKEQVRKLLKNVFPRSLACSRRRSESGERCEVEKAMESRRGTSPPLFLFFRARFYVAPLPTNWTPGTGYTKSGHTKMLPVFFSCLSVGAIFERNFLDLTLF